MSRVQLFSWLPFRRAAAVRGPTLRPYTRPKTLLQQAAVAFGLFALGAFSFLLGAFYGLTTPYLIVPLMIPVAILLLLVIWALPGTNSAPTGAMSWFFTAFFVALIIWPNYLAISLPAMPWITVLRLFGFPMALLLLIAVSVSSSFRDRIGLAVGNSPAVLYSLLAFTTAQLLTMPMPNAFPASLQKVLVSQVYWTAIFFVSVFIFLSKGKPTQWAVALWILILVNVAIAFAEEMREGILWANHIPSFLKVEDKQVQAILSGGRRLGGDYRVTGTATTPLGMAELFMMSAPFFLYFISTSKRLWVRIAAGLSLLLVFWAILLTGSRLGMIGLLVGLAISIFLWGLRVWKYNRGSIFGPAVVLAFPVAAAVFFAATLFVGRLRRITWGGSETQGSTDARYEQLDLGIPKILSNPFGYGAGRSANVVGWTAPGGDVSIDNYFLTLAVDFGVFGLVAFVVLIAAAIWSGVRLALSSRSDDPEIVMGIPLCASLAGFFVGKSVFSQDANHPLAFMMMGMVVALAWRASGKETASLSTLRNRH